MKRLFSAFFLFSLIIFSNFHFVVANQTSNKNLVKQLEKDKKELLEILSRLGSTITLLKEKSGETSLSEDKDMKEVLTRYEKVMKSLSKVKDGFKETARFALEEVKKFIIYSSNKNNEVFSIKMLIVYVFLAGQVYGASTAVFGRTFVDATLGYIFLPFFQNTFALLGVISIYAKVALVNNAEALQEFAWFVGFLVNSIILKFKAGFIGGILSSIWHYPLTAIYVYGIDFSKFVVGNLFKGVGVGAVLLNPSSYVNAGRWVIGLIH